MNAFGASPVFVCALALALLAGLAPRAKSADLVTQNFDSWPDTGNVWTNSVQGGWIINDGQIRPTRGGFGTVIGARGAWLNDFDATSNTWIRSPFMPQGVDSIRFQMRRNDGSVGEQFFSIQTSPDGTNWVTLGMFDRVDIDWSEASWQIGSPTPSYVRILKTGDQGSNQYLGVDSIEIAPPSGVILTGLQHQPTSPSSTTPVHVLVNAQISAESSNVVLAARYRQGISGAFSTIAMTNLAGTTYRTQTPIPAGYLGKVQYYIECAYTGFGLSPIYAPSPGSNSPAFYDTSNPYLSTARRQLSPSSHQTPLIISEIMYNPANTTTATLTFVELFNTEPIATELGGFRLDGNVQFTFPLGTMLPPRSFAVVAAVPADMEAAYGLANVFGPMTGGLPNTGGLVQLRNREGALLLEAPYDDAMPWPIAADGAGHSLVLSRPDYGEDDVQAWSASRRKGGSPGSADPLESAPIDQVVINEFLAHTDPPDVDSIELFNKGTQSVDLGGCTLSDRPDINKCIIAAGTILPAQGFILFAQTNLGFSLSSHGDDLYFGSADGTRVMDAVRYPAQINSWSTGRYPDGASELTVLGAKTLGASNNPGGMRNEDIVINELMYSPLSGDRDDQYVELFNKGTGTVDIGHWRFVNGITYTFAPGTRIPAGGYLVVARNVTNLLARYPQLNASNTAGNVSGQLSGSGERIALARPDDLRLPDADFVPVDEVTYNDGAIWGRWADGGGSSLELIDPRSDNRLPMNWAGSDETTKAAWTTVNYVGTIDNGTLTPSEMRVTYLGEGECLLDNVKVLETNGATYLDSNFESGLGGWAAQGNHSRSSLEPAEGYQSTRSLHLRATDTGREGTWKGSNTEPLWNRASTPLLGVPPSNALVSIQAKARWLAGWPHLTLALRGFWMAADVRLDVPRNLGTPGLPNSRARPNNGPAISEVTHDPILPAANQDAVVSCRVSDPDGVASATLYYRIDPDANYLAVAMNDAGLAGDARARDGRYSGTIPKQAAGARAAFTIRAVDAAIAPRTNAFPIPPLTGQPNVEGLVRFGQTLPAGVIGNYTLWMTDANVSRWQTISGSASKYSNEPIDLTFVYGDYRVIYGAGGRYRGLWRPYASPIDSGAYSISLPRSDRFLGAAGFDLDAIGQTGGDSTRQAEGYCYWIARQVGVPAAYVRYARVGVNEADRGLFHDLQSYGPSFYGSWYGDADPAIYKMEGWMGEALDTYVDGMGRYKQSRYRWFFDKRCMQAPSDDFTPLYDVVKAAAVTNDVVYEARMRALIDVRRWTGFFAVCGITAAWDHYGWSYTHNGFLYLPHDQGAALHIVDMDHVLTDNRDLFPSSAWPVPYRMYNRPVFRRMYLALLKELIEGPMTSPQTDTRMDSLYNAFLANSASVTAPDGWKAWVASRRASVTATLAPYAVAFTISSNGGADFATTNTIVTLSGTAAPEVDRIAINGLPNAVTYTALTSWTLRVGLPEGTNALQLTGLDWRGNLVASNSITVTVTRPPPSPLNQIIISEIMYHAPLAADDYIELYNRSASASFDLRGWHLNGTGLTFGGGSIIGPRQFAVIANNRAAYQHTYSNVETVVATYPGSLDDLGETLTLEMPTGSNQWTTVNAVTYANTPPWPTAAGGFGQSIQVVDLTRDNTQPANWAAVNTTPQPAWKFRTVSGVVESLVPSVLNTARLNLYLLSAGTALVDRVMLVTGTVAEAGANLLVNSEFESPLSDTWSAQGNHAGSFIVTTNGPSGPHSLALVSTGIGNTTGTNLVSQGRPLAAYAGQPMTLSYWSLESSAVAGLNAELSFSSVSNSHSLTPPTLQTSPIATPGTTNSVAAVLPDLPSLWINEVMPSNVTAWADNAGQFDPWIELYNAEAGPVDLTDYRLSNAYSDPAPWAFPSGLVIAAGERLVIWADAQTNQTDSGFVHASFALDPVSGSVVLARAYASQLLVLDALDYDQIGADFSFGSYPEGSPRTRQVFHTPTPGSPNTPLSLPVRVAINEWMADNAATISDAVSGKFADWFELYNPMEQPVNLGGYYLANDPANTNQFVVPGGHIIPARGYLLVWADGTPALNGPGVDLHTSFKLSKSGGAIAVYKPDGTLVDAIRFGAQTTDRSEGRWPDGDARITVMSPPTPRGTNSVLMVSGLPAVAADRFALNWRSASGTVYRVEGSTNLVATNWFILGVVTADQANLAFIDTNAAAHPVLFYRLQEQD